VIHRSELDNAQNTLRTRRPDLYFSNGDVRDNIEWMRILAQEVLNNTQGRVCAEPLGHDELRVKSAQDVSQELSPAARFKKQQLEKARQKKKKAPARKREPVGSGRN